MATTSWLSLNTTSEPPDLDYYGVDGLPPFERDSRDEQLAAIEVAVLAVILVAAVVGNSFVLVALWRQIHFCPRSRMYLFMLHLSAADLLVAVFSVLPQLIWKITFRFRGGDFLCRTVKYMQVMALYLSTYMLVMMAVDRYRAVSCTSSWHQWNSLRVAKWLVAVAWILSLVFAVPQALLFNVVQLKPLRVAAETDVAVSDCWVEFDDPWSARVYVTWFVASVFLVPLVVLVYCYGVITYRIWTYVTEGSVDERDEHHQMVNGRRPLHPNAKRRNPITSAKLKTIRLSFLVVLCFFICWSPFCITQLVMVYNPSNQAGPVETIFMLLACLNSCTNPWIYLAFSGSLVNHLRVCLRIGVGRARDNDSIGDDEPEPVRPKPSAVKMPRRLHQQLKQEEPLDPNTPVKVASTDSAVA